MGLVAEAARYDQVVGHEGKRAREAETRQAKEQEEGGQSRRVGEPALWRLEAEHAGPALERPSHQADPGERQPARHPHGQRPAELHRQPAGEPGQDHRRLTQRQRAHQATNVPLHDGKRCAVGGRDERGLREHHELRGDAVGMAHEQAHRRVGGHLRHRGRQGRRHRRRRKERRIPGVEGHDPLADHHRQRHEPAASRTSRARLRCPGGIQRQQTHADCKQHAAEDHHQRVNPGRGPAARRGPRGKPGGQERGDPEDHQHDRVGRGHQGRCERGAGQKPGDAADRDRPPRRHEHDRQRQERHQWQQDRRQPVEMHEAAAGELWPQQHLLAGARPPAPGERERRRQRRGQRPAGWQPRVMPRAGELGAGDPRQRRADGHGRGGREQAGAAQRVQKWHGVERGHSAPRSRCHSSATSWLPPSRATSRRSNSAAASSAASTGATTNRPTKASSKPRSSAIR